MQEKNNNKQRLPPIDYYELKREWYQKLKEAGFRDIEDEYTGILYKQVLNTWYDCVSKNDNERDGVHVLQARAEYFYMAEHFLESYRFEDEMIKQVWELHTEGIPIRSISTLMVKRGIKLSKSSVYRIVEKLRKIMLFGNN